MPRIESVEPHDGGRWANFIAASPTVLRETGKRERRDLDVLLLVRADMVALHSRL
jgi:hypothetical protein